MNPIGEAKKYVAELTRAEKEAQKSVIFECKPTMLITKGEQRSYNGGYLFLQKIYHDLGLHKICDTILKRQHKDSKNHDIKYNLNEILSMLLYTRILYPGSKLSSLEDAGRFIEQPHVELHQIYRALSLLSRESDFIQAQVYKNSLKLGERNTKVLYYDCTNYFFESEEESGLRQYGHSKENRRHNNVGERAFITVQSLKKLKGYFQEWALDCKGWHIDGREEEYDISALNPAEYRDITFHKDRWMIENCFRIMKTDFEARPVYLQRDDRIKAHFLAIQGEGYIPTYTRTDLTNALHGSAGFRTDTQIVPKQKMREIISATKNSRSSKEKLKEKEKNM